ncbi:MAG: murein L,D-transpeptidase catalytic domain family protein [Chitinophagaceae bacterium]|nr:murein L,D-transpeptidase catalytic domain family protein [Chitinophagaceae bacterium]
MLMGSFVFGTGKSKAFSKKASLTAHAPTTGKNSDKNVSLYDSLQLSELGLSKEAFEYAITGYNVLVESGKIQKDNILTIIDFSLPSSKKRLFVLDLASGQLLFNTFVSHGRNSGTILATKFSNAFNSFKSSLGFYTTADTYNGKHGFSLRLEGQEEGINDNAYNRGIVIHSAKYVTEKAANQKGAIGRSQGCPAIPEALKKPIIETIRNGSCLFVYSPDKYYVSHSKLLNNLAS